MSHRFAPSLLCALIVGVCGLLVSGCSSGGLLDDPDAAGAADGASSGDSDGGNSDGGGLDQGGADLATPGPPVVIYSGLTEEVISSAIAIAGNGRAEVALMTATGIIALRETDLGWVKDTVLSGGNPMAPLSMTLQNDTPWLSYIELNRPKYRLQAAHRGSMSWSVETVDDQLANRSSGGAPISRTGSGTLAIYYTTMVDTPSGYVDWTINTEWDGTTWSSKGYLQRGRPHGLALDSRGQLSIALYNDALTVPTYLAYSRQLGGRFYTYGVQADSLGVGPARLSVDSADHPHLVYCDLATSEIRYAYSASDGGSWEHNPLERTSTAFMGIGISPGDVPVIAYYEATKADVRIARRLHGRWQLETVDADGDVGRALSMAMDRSGRAHIVYYDATKQTLKRALR